MRTAEAKRTNQLMLHGSDGASRIYAFPEKLMLAEERIVRVLVNGKPRGFMKPEGAIAIEFGDREPEPETITVVLAGGTP
jgi:hypothetical protein